MYFIKGFLMFVLTVSVNAENYASASLEVPSQDYEIPAPQPTKPFTVYEAPAPAPSVEYDAPKIESEVVQPEIKYGPPPKPETKYGPPPQLETKYGPPPQPETKYGPPPQPETKYGPLPQPETKYGPPPQPEIKYGPPPQPQNKYGLPPAPLIRYGAPRRVVKVAPVTFAYRPFFVSIRRPILRYKLHIDAVPAISFPSRSYGFPVAPSRLYGALSF